MRVLCEEKLGGRISGGYGWICGSTTLTNFVKERDKFRWARLLWLVC